MDSDEDRSGSDCQRNAAHWRALEPDEAHAPKQQGPTYSHKKDRGYCEISSVAHLSTVLNFEEIVVGACKQLSVEAGHLVIRMRYTLRSKDKFDDDVSCRLTAEFSGGTPPSWHAGAQRSCALGTRPPAAEHFMGPRPLQRFVRRQHARGC